MKRGSKAGFASVSKANEEGEWPSSKPRKAVPLGVTVHVPLTLHLRGGRKTVISPVALHEHAPPSRKFDNALIKALARAHRWRRLIELGTFASITELARVEGVNQAYACRLLRLTLLSPEITEKILNGQQSPTLTLAEVVAGVPIRWDEQAQRFP